MLCEPNRRLYRLALLASCASVCPLATSAAPADERVERVVVTGSRLPPKGLTSLSPVTTIPRDEAKKQGTSSIETLLNSMPQVAADQTGEISVESIGTATVDVRGLGPHRTLVLINGRRMMPGWMNYLPTPDLNMVPVGMIERVEIVTGGASAVYGADAVAGVVNFILRKDFDGVEVSAQYGVYDHENNDALARSRIAFRAAARPEMFPFPSDHVNDGSIVSVSGVMGAALPHDAGGVMLYAQYRHAEPVLQVSRDFAGCVLQSNGTGETGGGFFAGFSCIGSRNSDIGPFQSFNRGEPDPPKFKATADGSFAPFDDEGDTFNFTRWYYLQRPDERYLLGATGRYRLAADVEAYAELSVGDHRDQAQTSPNGLFLFEAGTADGLYRVNCDNPFLQTGIAPNRPFDIFCGTGTGLGSADDASVNIARRFTEMPGRLEDRRFMAYRGVLGVSGDINRWYYDLYAQHGETTLDWVSLNYLSRSKINRALQVVDADPGPGVSPVCKSVLDGSDPSCVPANIFQPGQLTPAAIDYLRAIGTIEGRVSQTVVSGSLTGDSGIRSPWAQSPIDVAIGAEYRLERLRFDVNDALGTGDLAGSSQNVPASGRYDVIEAFGEVGIPIVEDATAATLLEVIGGYRVSEYDTAGVTHAYKYGVNWSPVEGVRLRASRQHAVRAPNIIELFSPQSRGGWQGFDPCASVDGTEPPVFSEAQCLNTGLTAEQYAVFAASASFQCPGSCGALYGGNPELLVESSETNTFGVVLAPTGSGLAVTVDYFDIDLTDTISVLPPETILALCGNTGDPTFCRLINRAPGTGLLLVGVGFVSQITQNIGGFRTTGIDIEANYKTDLGVIGAADQALSLNFVATSLSAFELEPVPGAAYDCKGLFGAICGEPTFEWRHKLRATWSSPWGLELSLAWRHFSAVELDVNTSDPAFAIVCNGPCNDVSDARIRPYDYLDISFSFELSSSMTLHGGINNVVDEDPPILDTLFLANGFATGNTYPGTYDVFGREIFIGLTVRR
jgi:outer membrane receptor protein involved in Fe transport